jgi:DNA-binding NarL/FixJ family response regulator
MIKIAIIEDDQTLRNSMVEILELKNEYKIVLLSSNVESFLASVDKNTEIDILLLDIVLPGMSGIDAIPVILEKMPYVKIVMNTVLEDSDSIYDSLKAGAIGYITKDMFLGDIHDTIFMINSGGSIMSPRIARKVIGFFQKNTFQDNHKLTKKEHEVVVLIVEGYSYKMIAEEKNVSINTVNEYIKRIYNKLQINSKGQLFAIYNSQKKI